MKARLLSNYITTILGCVILIFCGLIMYQEKQTAGELSGWLTTGLLFLRSKDSLINLPKKEH
tara:strand:+ start:410 stop:595 length:186 start_codon:yes stop_codon:yes gene_type:complete